MRLLLDTHVWLWWLMAHAALPDRERRGIERSASRGGLCLSAISLWEAQMLHAKGRIETPVPFGEWLRRASDPRILTVLPLDVDVVLALGDLPATFHGDPADRLIVATAKVHRIPMATHDDRIRRLRAVRIWKAGR